MFYQVMRTELIKLRRAPVWIAFFALTALSAVMGTFNYLNNTGILTQQWYSLWTQHTLFAGFFFLPSLLGVLCAYLWRMEHCEHNWNALMSRPVPLWMIFGGKLAVAAALSFLTQAATGAFYLISGLYAGFDAPLPPELPRWLLMGVFGAAAHFHGGAQLRAAGGRGAGGRRGGAGVRIGRAGNDSALCASGAGHGRQRHGSARPGAVGRLLWLLRIFYRRALGACHPVAETAGRDYARIGDSS